MTEFKSLEDGKILIISSTETSKIVPLFCPVCSFPMKTIEDSLSFRKYECCNLCEIYWTRTKFGKWEDGWRPNSQTEGWEDYVNYRKALSRNIITLK